MSEPSKASPNKYSYDLDRDRFELKTVMLAGMNLPYDFGFVPSTLAGDGDPPDVPVLMVFRSASPKRWISSTVL